MDTVTRDTCTQHMHVTFAVCYPGYQTFMGKSNCLTMGWMMVIVAQADDEKMDRRPTQNVSHGE